MILFHLWGIALTYPPYDLGHMSPKGTFSQVTKKVSRYRKVHFKIPLVNKHKQKRNHLVKNLKNFVKLMKSWPVWNHSIIMKNILILHSQTEINPDEFPQVVDKLQSCAFKSLKDLLKVEKPTLFILESLRIFQTLGGDPFWKTWKDWVLLSSNSYLEGTIKVLYWDLENVKLKKTFCIFKFSTLPFLVFFSLI